LSQKRGVVSRDVLKKCANIYSNPLNMEAAVGCTQLSASVVAAAGYYQHGPVIVKENLENKAVLPSKCLYSSNSRC
jgi:hypothetical protein